MLHIIILDNMGGYFYFTLVFTLYLTVKAQKAVFYNEKGILLDPIQNIITTQGYTSIPISVSFPSNFSSIDNRGCLHRLDIIDWDVMRLQMKGVLQLSIPSIRTTYDEASSQPSTRKKRFLDTILGVAGIGMGTWNRFSITELQDNQEVLISKMTIIQENIKNLHQSSQGFYEELGKIHHFVFGSVEKLSEDIESLECNYVQNLKKIVEWDLWMNTIVSDFRLAIDFLLIGKISPSLIPYSQLIDLANNFPEVKSMLDHLNPASFYDLVTAAPLYIDIENMAIFAMLSVPVIDVEIKHDSYRILSVPWIVHNHSYKFKVPASVALSDSIKVAWIPKSETCQSTGQHYICPFDNVEMYQDLCLTNLLYMNKTTGCDILIKNISSTPEIKTFSSGLLMGAYYGEPVACSMEVGNVPPTILTTGNNLSQIIKRGDCKALHVQSRSYYTPRGDYVLWKIHLHINISVHIRNIDLSKLDLVDWTSLQSVPLLLTEPSGSGKISWIMIIFFFGIILSGLIIYLWRQKIRIGCQKRMKCLRKQEQPNNILDYRVQSDPALLTSLH